MDLGVPDAVVERVYADSGPLLLRSAVINVGQLVTVVKGEGVDSLQTGGEVNRGHAAAFVKGPATDKGHAFRDHDAGQTVAFVEGKIVDILQPLRERDLDQIVPFVKGPVADAGDALFDHNVTDRLYFGIAEHILHRSELTAAGDGQGVAVQFTTNVSNFDGSGFLGGGGHRGRAVRRAAQIRHGVGNARDHAEQSTVLRQRQNAAEAQIGLPVAEGERALVIGEGDGLTVLGDLHRVKIKLQLGLLEEQGHGAAAVLFDGEGGQHAHQTQHLDGVSVVYAVHAEVFRQILAHVHQFIGAGPARIGLGEDDAFLADKDRQNIALQGEGVTLIKAFLPIGHAVKIEEKDVAVAAVCHDRVPGGEERGGDGVGFLLIV